MKRPTWQFYLLVFAILSLLSTAVDASFNAGESIEKREASTTTTTHSKTHTLSHHYTKHHNRTGHHHKIHTVYVNNCTAAAIQKKHLSTAINIATITSTTRTLATPTNSLHQTTVYVCHKTKHVTGKHHSTTSKKHHSSKHTTTTTKHVSKKHHSSSKKENNRVSKKYKTKKHTTTTTHHLKKHSTTTHHSKKHTTTTHHSKKHTTTTTIKKSPKKKTTTTTRPHKKHTTTEVVFVPASLPTTRVVSSGDNDDSNEDSNNQEQQQDTSSDSDTTDSTTPTTDSSSPSDTTAAGATTPTSDSNNQVTAQSVNNEKSVDAAPQSKVIGVSVGAVVGCIAAAGLAGMFIYRRKQKTAQEQDIEEMEQNSPVNTRWKTQSFMAVVAGAVAKLPKRSNSSASERSIGVFGSIRRAVSNASSLRSSQRGGDRSSQQSYGMATSEPLPPLARIDGDQARYYNEPSSPHGNHTHAY